MKFNKYISNLDGSLQDAELQPNDFDEVIPISRKLYFARNYNNKDNGVYLGNKSDKNDTVSDLFKEYLEDKEELNDTSLLTTKSISNLTGIGERYERGETPKWDSIKHLSGNLYYVYFQLDFHHLEDLLYVDNVCVGEFK